METIFKWEVTGLIGYTAASATTSRTVELALTGSLEARATICLYWVPATTLAGVGPETTTSMQASETIFCLAALDMTFCSARLAMTGSMEQVLKAPLITCSEASEPITSWFRTFRGQA